MVFEHYFLPCYFLQQLEDDIPIKIAKDEEKHIVSLKVEKE
jgi:hypothetical protein